MNRMKVVHTEMEHWHQVEVGGMDTEAEGTDHMAPEVERMAHMDPEVVRRRSTKLGEAAKHRHWSDDVSERYHPAVLVTRRAARAP